MTIEPDPLDELVSRTVRELPVPAGLEARILRSAALRRRARWAVAGAGLAAAVLVLLWPRPRAVEPSGAGPVFSLREPEPAALDLKRVAFTVEVRPDAEGLAIRFIKGGPTDE